MRVLHVSDTAARGRHIISVGEAVLCVVCGDRLNLSDGDLTRKLTEAMANAGNRFLAEQVSA